MGLGDFISRKASEAKQGLKSGIHEGIEHERKEREKRRALNEELKEIRWNNYVDRRKKEATTESPGRSSRVINTLGKAGEVGNRVSVGVFGGAEFDPSGGGGFGSSGKRKSGVSIDPYGGDPFFSGAKHGKPKHHGGGRVGSQDIHIHLHNDRRRRR